MGLYLMAALYISAGLVHFINPKFYRPLMPPIIPMHDLMIYLSGFAEVILGSALFFEKTRSFAAWGVILLLIAVMPVHIYMIQERNRKFKNVSKTFLFVRPFLQLPLMYWAFLYT